MCKTRIMQHDSVVRLYVERWMLNFNVRKKEHSTSKVINVHDSYYATPSASCIHGSHAVDVAARRGRGISWYPSHGMRSTLQWGYCSLACHASHVTWSDRRPGYVARFRNLMPSLRAGRAAEMGYTLKYCSQDNSRASTNCGSLTRYMRGATGVQSTLRLIICDYGCVDPAVLIIRIRLISPLFGAE